MSSRSWKHTKVRSIPTLSRCGLRTFNFTSPSLSIELREPSSASDIDNTTTTPKLDISVRISRDAFGRDHARFLDLWQIRMVILGDPHTTQGGLRFLFFIVEAKDLSADSNLIGARKPEKDAPPFAFSCATKGLIHEL